MPLRRCPASRLCLVATAIVALAAAVVPARSAEAQPIDTVLNLAFQNLDLSSPSLESGTANQPGAVYFHDNVATVGADVIDARIELLAEVNCSVNPFDSSSERARAWPRARARRTGASSRA